MMHRATRRFGWFAAAVLASAMIAGCAGPPVPAPIEDVPTCADFTSGNAKMQGGLKNPVRLRVLDGKTVLFNMTLSGLRHADDAKPRTFIVDDNAKYTVEWAQCQNARAPRPLSESTQSAKARDRTREEEGTGYDCGEAAIYKSDVLETKKGDRASHVIHFATPPEASCWAAEASAPRTTVVDAGVATAAEDAGAPDAGPATLDGGATPLPTTSASAGAGAARPDGGK